MYLHRLEDDREYDSEFFRYLTIQLDGVIKVIPTHDLSIRVVENIAIVVQCTRCNAITPSEIVCISMFFDWGRTSRLLRNASKLALPPSIIHLCVVEKETWNAEQLVTLGRATTITNTVNIFECVDRASIAYFFGSTAFDIDNTHYSCINTKHKLSSVFYHKKLHTEVSSVSQGSSARTYAENIFTARSSGLSVSNENIKSESIAQAAMVCVRTQYYYQFIKSRTRLYF